MMVGKLALVLVLAAGPAVAQGIITTVAGNGATGSSGDGGYRSAVPPLLGTALTGRRQRKLLRCAFAQTCGYGVPGVEGEKQ